MCSFPPLTCISIFSCSMPIATYLTSFPPPGPGSAVLRDRPQKQELDLTGSRSSELHSPVTQSDHCVRL